MMQWLESPFQLKSLKFDIFFQNFLFFIDKIDEEK
jgi:hypothetical protein